MNSYAETELRIRFERGDDISIDIVDDGVEIENKTFNRRSSQIEEVIDYINGNEYEYDVYF